MRKSIEIAVKALALTAAIAVGTGETAQADTSQIEAAKRERATEKAGQISAALYDKKAYPKDVLVPGILRGAVMVIDESKNATTGIYENPILLTTSPRAEKLIARHKIDSRGKWLDGSWFATRSQNADGRVVLAPFQLHLGNHGDTFEGILKEDGHESVTLENDMGVYPAKVKDLPGLLPLSNWPAPTYSADTLVAFDITGEGRYQSVFVRALGFRAVTTHEG